MEALERLLSRAELSVVEYIWEAEVASRRLHLKGRADLIAVLSDDTLAVVEAKPRVYRSPGRRLPQQVQAIAYGVAAEETLARLLSLFPCSPI